MPPRLAPIHVVIVPLGKTDEERAQSVQAAENLKRVPLTALTSSIMPGMGTPVRMRCGNCMAKFLG